MNKKIVLPVACVAALVSASLHAAPQVKINGFLSAGAAVSGSEVPYEGNVTEDLSFGADTVYGIQVTADLSEKMSATGQLLAKEERNVSFDVQADWLYLKYSFSDSLVGRAGKLRLPLFIASDYLEVGYAYPWISPPVAVYNQVPLNSYTGADLLFNTEAGPFELQLQSYFGNIRGEVSQWNHVVETITNNLMGVNATLTGELGSFRVGYVSTEASMIDQGGGLNPAGTAGASLFDDADTSFTSIGATLDWNNVVGYAEFASIKVDSPAFPDTEGWYVTAGYRMGKYLPLITLSESEPSEPAGKDQSTITLGLNYELSGNTVIKAEYKTVDAKKTGGAPYPETFGFFKSDPEGDVGIFKVAVDVVF